MLFQIHLASSNFYTLHFAYIFQWRNWFQESYQSKRLQSEELTWLIQHSLKAVKTSKMTRHFLALLVAVFFSPWKTSCFICAKPSISWCKCQRLPGSAMQKGSKQDRSEGKYLPSSPPKSMANNTYHSKLITTFQGSMSVSRSVSVPQLTITWIPTNLHAEIDASNTGQNLLCIAGGN